VLLGIKLTKGEEEKGEWRAKYFGAYLPGKKVTNAFWGRKGWSAAGGPCEIKSAEKGLRGGQGRGGVLGLGEESLCCGGEKKAESNNNNLL